MTRWMPTASIAALIVPVAIGAHRMPAQPSSPAPLGSITVNATPTAHGCAITFKAHNNGGYKIAISKYSKVRVGKLPWKDLGQTVWVSPHSGATWTYDLSFGCNYARTFRMLLKQFRSAGPATDQAYHNWYTHDGSPVDLGAVDRIF